MELFEGMDPLLKTFWFVALPSSLIFIVQTIMTFVGGDATDGTDADFDSNLEGTDAPFQLFSLRNLINFLLGFSWTGISFFSFIENKLAVIAIAVVVGVLFVLLFFLVIRQLKRLAEDNSFRMSDTVNQTAEVYLAIPGAKSGKGKVLVSVKGSVHELEAMTENEKIETGSVVRVVRVDSGGKILFVEKI